ncbi:MAG TPA: uridine kinase [Sphingobacterium sp.]|nr:uridine kinase [Sphingobacterium sp.]
MNKPFVIGIAGNSGSGKTFFLRSFLQHFRTNQIALISQDDYYIPAHTKTKEENKLYNFDLPTAIDRCAFYRDIKYLFDGKTVYKEEYTFNNAQATPRLLEIKPAPILIIEGLFIYYYSEINALLDYRIFLDVAEQVALRRRICRDFVERGYNEEDVRYKWNNHVLPAYKKYLLPFRDSCNKILINNTNDPTMIQQALLSISKDLKNVNC